MPQAFKSNKSFFVRGYRIRGKSVDMMTCKLRSRKWNQPLYQRTTYNLESDDSDDPLGADDESESDFNNGTYNLL